MKKILFSLMLMTFALTAMANPFEELKGTTWRLQHKNIAYTLSFGEQGASLVGSIHFSDLPVSADPVNLIAPELAYQWKTNGEGEKGKFILGLINGSVGFKIRHTPERGSDDQLLALKFAENNYRFFKPHLDSSGSLLHFQSLPGDYIGQGKQTTWKSKDGYFQLKYNGSNHVSLNFKESKSHGVWWDADFAAPKNETLTTKLYTNATRYPFQKDDSPGLDFGGDGRGCNRLTGEFQVLNMGFDKKGRLNRFSAFFIQNCEGSMPPLTGTVHFGPGAGEDQSSRDVSIQLF